MPSFHVGSWETKDPPSDSLRGHKGKRAYLEGGSKAQPRKLSHGDP